MCRMVRELSPNSKIVIGGHVAATPGLEDMIDADHIVRGEGISWMRRYLGEDEKPPSSIPKLSPDSKRESWASHAGEKRADGSDDHSVGRLSDGLQFLHDLGVLWRQGQVRKFLRNRRPALRCLLPCREIARSANLLRHGRKFSPPQKARHAPARAHERRQQGLGHGRLRLGERHPPIHAGGTGGTWRLLDLDGPGVSALELRQAQGHGLARAHAHAARARHSGAGLDHHRARTPHARQHPRRDRIRGRA